jgi:hypothetical protein
VSHRNRLHVGAALPALRRHKELLMDDLLFIPEDLPPWLLRTELPTIVCERCTKAQQISVWRAIRWLLAVQRRTTVGLASREIADRAKVDVKGIKRYTQELAQLGLLEIVGHEDTGNGNTEPRPVYRIPSRVLEEENIVFTRKFAANYLNTFPIAANQPHADQLALPLGDAAEADRSDPKTDQSSDPKTDQRHFRKNTPSDPKTDQSSDPKTDQPDPKTDQSSDPKTDQSSDPKTDHGWMDGRIMEGREESGAPPARKKRGRPKATPPVPPPPPPELFAAHPSWQLGLPLTEHPTMLWQKASVHDRPIDLTYLAGYASKHDEPTSGFGWWWVGQAILAVARSKDVYSVEKVNRVLERWREEDSYGSDLPTRKATHNDNGSGGTDAARPADRKPYSRASGRSGQASAQRDDPAGGNDASDVPDYLRQANSRDVSTGSGRDATADEDIPEYLR